MRRTQSAPAKINLGLHVLRQRPDGYHDVETVLHRIDWADTITARPADELSMRCTDPGLPTDERNLCLAAARLLRDAFGVESGATLHLEKRVPYGAGLGSGSSDAAATLELLSHLWALEASRAELQKIAGQIGADVPFFLEEAPAAYATGRGDTLSPLSTGGTAYRLPYPILVAVPDVHVSTATAYEGVTPRETERPDLPELVASNDLSRWRAELGNDFESLLVASEPRVASLRQALVEAGAEYVSLSGSGAAVYGLFSSGATARAARERVDWPDIQTHLTEPAE